MKKRLNKALAASGIASRRKADEWIQRGRVTVNGEKTFQPETLIDWQNDTIRVDGKIVKGEEKKVYFLLHKPAKCICTAQEKKGGAKRVLDLFSHLSYRLFTVGRLDIDTTGPLLVTNDGDFANKIMHPSFGILKEYLVKVFEEISSEHLQTLSAGLKIEGDFVRPVSVKKVRRGTLKIVVREGKKHEVRLLIAHAGLMLQSLSRIRIGPLNLGNLPLGAYRELTGPELKFFMS